MQIEISLLAPEGAAHSGSDLGYLLHKHPDHVHRREAASGDVMIFYTEVTQTRTTAVLHLDIDPIALVRGKGQGDGLLDRYVNDRPYVANSFLSVALGRSFGQTMSGKSKERQDLANTALPIEVRVTPIAASGGAEIIARLFEPLGYTPRIQPLDESGPRGIYDLRLSATVRLSDLTNHLYVLVPVLDNTTHWWVDKAAIDKLLAKGEGWLADHPEKDLITRRALKHRRALVEDALVRLTGEPADDATDETPRLPGQEEVLEKPIRLHDLRLDTVAGLLVEHRAASVLDLGCGEGRLIQRLIKERGIDRILGVDPSVRTLERATRRLYLDKAGDVLRARVALQMGSLTYGDRRWQGFDAATLVEVIEHIDPPRLSALELSLFGDARPALVIVTTPNRDYNALFEGMPPDTLRHPDHRFEWTRAEFQAWSSRVAGTHGYTHQIHPLGPEDATHGAPSQMAVFTLGVSGAGQPEGAA